jgi:hypothetical protein
MMSHVLTMDGMGLEGLIESHERPTPKKRRPAQPKIQAKIQAGTPVRPDQAAKNAAKNAGDLALAMALTAASGAPGTTSCGSSPASSTRRSSAG